MMAILKLSCLFWTIQSTNGFQMFPFSIRILSKEQCLLFDGHDCRHRHRRYDYHSNLYAVPDNMDTQQEQQKSGIFSQQVMEEANDALVSVGWSAPSADALELTSMDPFVQSIDASIQREMGVSLDELLNPAKVRKDT
jgi:hypothetical protein